jgi:hypothetical protein
MSLEAKLLALVNAVGPDIKALNTAKGDLAALTTANKTNLVAALNEVRTLAQSGTGLIDDAAGDGIVNKTWSANKTFDEIAAAIAALRLELRAGAGAALDTFAEVAAQLATDESAAAALATAVGFRVRFDAAQVLTAGEKTQARSNMGAADALALTALTTAVGNTEQDLVVAYTVAKT